MKTILVSLLSLGFGLAMACAAEKGGNESGLVVMDEVEASVTDVVQSEAPAVLLNRVLPVYPMDCRMKGVTGRVEVLALVGPTGDVLKTEIIRSSNREFSAAALAAIEQWTFKPAVRNGREAAARIMIPVRFEMPELQDSGYQTGLLAQN